MTNKIDKDELERQIRTSGLSDRALAAKLGIGAGVVYGLRRKLGLPGKPLRTPHEDAIRKLVESRTMNDREISKKMGVSQAVVFRIRTQMGLPRLPKADAKITLQESIRCRLQRKGSAIGRLTTEIAKLPEDQIADFTQWLFTQMGPCQSIAEHFVKQAWNQYVQQSSNRRQGSSG